MDRRINLSLRIEADDAACAEVRTATFMLLLNRAVDSEGVHFESIDADPEVEALCYRVLCMD